MPEGEAPGLPNNENEYCLPAPDEDYEDYALPPAPALSPEAYTMSDDIQFNWRDQDANGTKYQRGFRAYQSYQSRPPPIPGSKPSDYETDLRSLGSGESGGSPDDRSLGSAQLRARKAMFPPADGDHWQDTEEWQEHSMEGDVGQSPPRRVYDREAELGHAGFDTIEPDPEGLEGGPHRRYGPRPMGPPELSIPNGASRPVPDDLGHRPPRSDTRYGVMGHVDDAQHVSEQAGCAAKEAEAYGRRRPSSLIFHDDVSTDTRDEVKYRMREAKEEIGRAHV